jgi:ribosome modulation factor
MKNIYYEAGYDAGVNGPNTTNCNFRLFDTKEHMEMWSAGNKKGLAKKAEGGKINQENED